MIPEEKIERAIESFEVFLAMNEEASERRPHVGAATNADPLERAQGIGQPAMVHIEAGGAEHAAEQQHVARECGVAHDRAAPRASARLSSVCSRSPRTDSMSSWFLRSMPRVSSTVSASSALRFNATSAAAQSMVSETPAVL